MMSLKCNIHRKEPIILITLPSFSLAQLEWFIGGLGLDRNNDIHNVMNIIMVGTSHRKAISKPDSPPTTPRIYSRLV